LKNGFDELIGSMVDSGPLKDKTDPIYINKINLFKEINSLTVAVILD